MGTSDNGNGWLTNLLGTSGDSAYGPYAGGYQFPESGDSGSGFDLGSIFGSSGSGGSGTGGTGYAQLIPLLANLLKQDRASFGGSFPVNQARTAAAATPPLKFDTAPVSRETGPLERLALALQAFR